MTKKKNQLPYRLFTLLEPAPRGVVELEKKHPKLLRVVEPAAKTIDDFVENKLGITLDRFETYVHPQEDYLLVSTKYPVFTVADGVTLEFGDDKTYPVPSPAGDVSRIFCEQVIKEGEKQYKTVTKDSIASIFRTANAAVGDYNKRKERTKETINFWDIDFFSATAAFGMIKENTLYWGSICDSYVLHFNGKGKLIFKSPYPALGWNKVKAKEPQEKQKIYRRNYRNKVNERGEPMGYGVVTGEETAEYYLQRGSFPLHKGAIIFFVTDGFEPYLKLKDFITLFKTWPEDLKEKVKAFTRIKSKENPARFSHERSLIALSIS